MKSLNNENSFFFSTRKVHGYAQLIVDEGFTVQHIFEMVEADSDTKYYWKEPLSDTPIYGFKNQRLVQGSNHQDVQDLTTQLEQSKADMATIAKAFVQLLLHIEKQSQQTVEKDRT